MSVDSQLESDHAGLLYLVELEFTSGTQRITNWSHNLEWMGHTWIGISVLSVSAISESERLEYPALELGLSIANPSHLALALGAVALYRGKPITLYQAVLDDELRAVGDPEIAWVGVMDQIRLKTGDGEQEEGAVSLRCERPGRDGRGATSLRLNDAQHRARHPGDTFLSRIEALTGKPVVWLSKRFQKV